MTRAAKVVAFIVLAACAANAAQAAEPVALSLMGHKFTPSEFTVTAGQKFQIKVTNLDDTPAEFESHDLKVEKIVVPMGTITVTAGPLKPGTYQFFDDYNPDLAMGTVTAKD